jgi:aminoglycoside 6'-N-acetyltransferase I
MPSLWRQPVTGTWSHLSRQGCVLVQLAEQWAREKGCSEMGSDTWLENESSISAHLRLGYVEVERLVHFVKRL